MNKDDALRQALAAMRNLYSNAKAFNSPSDSIWQAIDQETGAAICAAEAALAEPAARNPLTDEAIEACAREVIGVWVTTSHGTHLNAFARAVERAHGIK